MGILFRNDQKGESMSNKPIKKLEKETQIEFNEYHKIELNEIYGRIRGYASLRSQMYAFIGSIPIGLLVHLG
jgi:hypothetical protein